MCNSETFNKILCRKNEFYSSLNCEKKEYHYVLKIWNKFEMKTMQEYDNLYLKCSKTRHTKFDM